jgi:single-stranded-DNA-specific exonuclease
MDGGDTVLEVTVSATGRRWVGPGAAVERLGLAIAQATGEPEIVGRVLARRGVLPETAAEHLAPTLRALMPDPSLMAGMDAAAERLAEAVARREPVALFGDYDVDGAASVALLRDWLRRLGHDATVHIPDRLAEGYGPNAPAMKRLAAGHGLILCLDCGTLAHEPIAEARAAGADVIVLDHHLPGGTLPEAVAVVNPNRLDCAAGLGQLAAAGVVFMTLVAANRALRRRGGFGRTGEPDLRALLDLVALATVADVAPLTGLNRAFVRQGLAVMARRERPGLAALADSAGLSAPPSSRDLGFALGPRINAGGRIGASDLGARLLAAGTRAEADPLAAELETLNRRRRRIESDVLEAAIAAASARDVAGPLVWAAGEGWHPGVLGIVAGRLKERFNRPAVVIGLEKGEGKGSGRSVEGVDIGSAVVALAREGLLAKGGGHAMAAGLTVAEGRLAPAMDALAARLAAEGAGRAGPRDLAVDGVLAPAGATPELVRRLESAGPFGQASPPPRLVFPGVRIERLREVGQGHAQARLGGSGGGSVEAICFGAADSGLLDFLEGARRMARPVHVAGRLVLDDWGGRRRAKLELDDAAGH